jgi:hypothetical protein
MLVGIPSHEIHKVWGQVSPMLKKAVDKGPGDYSLDDILVRLEDRDMQLWVWSEDDKPVACAVTSIVCYPQRRVAAINYVAGTKMKAWLPMQKRIEAWARAHSCEALEGYGRRGWLRALRDWKQVSMTMRHSLVSGGA